MAVELVVEDGRRVVHADTYQLRIPADGHSVELCDAAGTPWTRLCLLAALDRVDVADESFDASQLEVARVADTVEVSLAARSAAWTAKRVIVRCFADRLEYLAVVEGRGTLTTARLLGGKAVLATGACGSFTSSIGFSTVFVPTPTEPVQVVRPASTSATLGIVGDAAPGRVHGIFSPPPLCLAFGREQPVRPTDVPPGAVLSVGVVAAVSDLRFTELRYLPLDGGYALELDYDGHTTIAGHFETPIVVLRPVDGPWQALATHRDDLTTRSFARDEAPPAAASWWTEPIFCGWGAQCAAASAAGVPAPELCRQERYDGWLALLAEHGIRAGTIVIDDRWQARYGTGVPDASKWPDLREWIAARHGEGQRVLLWWKAWDPQGLPDDECVLTASGHPIAADPGSPQYLHRLQGIVRDLVGPDGLDADGFKIDFTQRAPAGRSLHRPGAPQGAPWGIAALHVLLATMHAAAKAAKPDALLVTHTPHPGFGDVTDMVRLNDVLDCDSQGRRVPAADQLAFRHAVVAASLPHHPIDTDQWPIADRAAWRAYVAAQVELGVPALYYAEAIDGSGELLTPEDYALVRRTWQHYRAQRG